MSIMQEYETIRKMIGKKKYKKIEAFLKRNPQFLLSDVLYSEEVYNKFVQWEKNQAS
jgi:hypothetical protein